MHQNLEEIKIQRHKERIARAWALFAHNVSIAGLVEMYNASYKTIKGLWIITLTLALFSILYHATQLIRDYFQQRPAFQVIPTSKLIIPFPNITACVPAGINKTFALEHLIIPPRVEKILNKLSKEEKQKFIDQAIVMVSFSMENMADLSFTASSPLYREYHEVTTRTNDDYPRGAQAFNRDSIVHCEDTVIDCFFSGIPYDCCRNSVLKLADGGRVSRYRQQDKSLGSPRSDKKPITFQFDLIMDWQHVPFYSNTATDGFSLHVADPWSMFGRPVAVPAGMHIQIDISRPTWKIDRTNCISGENLPSTKHGPYDPRALNCKTQRIWEKIFPKYFFDCQFLVGSFMPNESVACPGITELPFRVILAGRPSVDQDDKRDAIVRQDVRDAFHGKGHCLPICSAWEYEPKIGYSQLVHFDEFDQTELPNVSRSRVTVFIGSPFYEERTEEALVPFYETFVDIAYVMALYGGISVITFAEILFYGLHVCCAYKKKIRKNRVDIFPVLIHGETKI